MRTIGLASVVPVLVVLGCGGSRGARATEDPDSIAADEHAGKVTGKGAGTAVSDCSTWRSWTKVSNARFVSKGHGKKWVDVYVEPQFVEAYMSGGAAMPAGMRVVKAGYADEAGTKFEALTVMGKMPAGYDPEHGDWYYGVLAEDGVTAKMQGKLETCIDCHSQADARDYLFGTDGQ